MSRRSTNFLCAALLAAAAAIRLAGINQQLWLDEIWSIRWAQSATHVWDILTLHTDNNHWLNTLYLRCLGAGRPWWTYHVLAEATGIGTVVLGWRLSGGSVVALILLATSDFLVEYSTDARGYAPSGFFALLCVWLMQRHLNHPRRWSAAAIATSAILGMLSHFTFVVMLAGLVLAWAVALRRRNTPWATVFFRTATVWAWPVGLAVALYCFDVQFMVRPRGVATSPHLAGDSAAMVLLGMPAGFVATAIGGAVAMAIVAWQIVAAWQTNDSAWPVYLAAWMWVIVLVCFFPRTQYIHPRYFYVAVPLLMLLMGVGLERLIIAGGAARWAAAAALAGVVAMNAWRITFILQAGRGNYLGALQYLVAHTSRRQIVVDGWLYPSSTLLVMNYYDQYHVHSGRLFHLELPPSPAHDAEPEHAQWIVSEANVGPTMTNSQGVNYIRRAVFPKATVTSGIPWTLYEADDGGTAPDHNLQPWSLLTQ